MKSVALGDLCDIRSGGTPSRSDVSFYGGCIPWAKISDIEASNGLLESTEESLTEEGLRAIRGRLFPEGTLLFAIYGSIGKMAFASRPVSTNQAILGIQIVDAKRVDSRYLFRWLESRRGYLTADGLGIAQKNLSAGYLRALQVPLPPLEEQKRIAAILDQADSLRRLRQRAIDRLNTLGQAIFYKMFGDPAANPMGWSVRELSEVISGNPNNGIFRKNPEYLPNSEPGLPVVWVEELFRGHEIDVSSSRRLDGSDVDYSRYSLKYGDILFCRSSLKLDGIAFNNVYLGEDDEALFECHVIRISPNKRTVCPIFLNTLLRTPQMRRVAKSKSKTSTMTTIDQKALLSIKVILPPLKLQKEYAENFSVIVANQIHEVKQRQKYDGLFLTLQHRAFRGDL